MICKTPFLFFAGSYLTNFLEQKSAAPFRPMKTEQRAKELGKVEDDWTVNRLLIVAFLIHVLLIFYASEFLSCIYLFLNHCTFRHSRLYFQGKSL
jgi:hypothetical protein